MTAQRAELVPEVASIMNLARTAPASTVRQALHEAVAGIVELTASNDPGSDGGHLLGAIRHDLSAGQLDVEAARDY
ncbi:MAG TPA: hypothetical protein VHK88_18645 [Aquihabitans sp.]|jgi:hypothetical protein|nr:hypothetical protein [Aquihabitans sp.]